MTWRLSAGAAALALLLLAACPAWAAHWQDNQDGTVLDTTTGLAWTRTPVQGDTLSAPKQCEDLNLAGHDDWRLPTADELESMLMDPFYPMDFAGVLGFWSADVEYPDAFHWKTAYVTAEGRGWEEGLAPFPRSVHCVRKDQNEVAP